MLLDAMRKVPPLCRSDFMLASRNPSTSETSRNQVQAITLRIKSCTGCKLACATAIHANRTDTYQPEEPDFPHTFLHAKTISSTLQCRRKYWPFTSGLGTKHALAQRRMKGDSTHTGRCIASTAGRERLRRPQKKSKQRSTRNRPKRGAANVAQKKEKRGKAAHHIEQNQSTQPFR